MKHIVISDTHTPLAINQSYNYCKTVLVAHPDVDAIVINGDVLGIFSISSARTFSKDELTGILEQAAPNFYEEYKTTGTVTKSMVSNFVAERYAWAFAIIKKFSDLHFTIFNLGNHESENHMLVLQELPFLVDCPDYLFDDIDKESFKPIVKDFENKLYALESSGNFRYIRDKPLIMGKTLILGIPGENHDTERGDYLSGLQEEKTKELIAKIRPHLSKVHSIIIYNHTQGRYDKQTGKFWTASNALSDFMNTLPDHILQQIFVQSHNHWSYSQLLSHQSFTFLLNNAGLHNGIFNLIDFDIMNVTCYDVDPVNKKMTKLKMSMEHPMVQSDRELIARFYDNPDYVLNRKHRRA